MRSDRIESPREPQTRAPPEWKALGRLLPDGALPGVAVRWCARAEVRYTPRERAVDRVIPPMFGPKSTHRLKIDRRKRPEEVLRVTAARADIKHAMTGAAESREYLCHDTLQFNSEVYDP